MKFAEMIVLLGIFVVLPIIIVAIVARAKTNATNKRAQIALAAIEAPKLRWPQLRRTLMWIWKNSSRR